jgi:hypothetical protein
MGITMLTDQSGNPLALPEEATPRQQFVTSPFAIRALQSEYANGAKDEFQAEGGVNTPSLNSDGSTLDIQADDVLVDGLPMVRSLLVTVFGNGGTIASAPIPASMDTSLYEVFIGGFSYSRPVEKVIVESGNIVLRIDTSIIGSWSASVRVIAIRKGLVN